eukprot:6822506-Pyramimonas_sp.AAC.1
MAQIRAASISRNAVSSAVAEAYDAVGTSIELPMADKAEKPFNWHVGNVGNLLRHVCRESSEYAAIIERAVE